MGFFRDRRADRSGGSERGRGRPDEPSHDAGAGAGGAAASSDRLSDAQLQEDVERVLARELSGVLTDDGSVVPARLTPARVIAWITEYGYAYFLDSDGDIGGLWHSRLFYFLLFGPEREILQVRGQWNREITIERIGEVLEFCNEWNTERIWPKAYFRVRDNGMIQVYGEVAVDFEHGASDVQLDQVLTCGLSTGAMLFDALDELYPDPAQVAP